MKNKLRSTCHPAEKPKAHNRRTTILSLVNKSPRVHIPCVLSVHVRVSLDGAEERMERVKTGALVERIEFACRRLVQRSCTHSQEIRQILLSDVSDRQYTVVLRFLSKDQKSQRLREDIKCGETNAG